MKEGFVNINFSYESFGMHKNDRNLKVLNISNNFVQIKVIELEKNSDSFPLVAKLKLNIDNNCEIQDKNDNIILSDNSIEYRVFNNQLMRPFVIGERKVGIGYLLHNMETIEKTFTYDNLYASNDNYSSIKKLYKKYGFHVNEGGYIETKNVFDHNNIKTLYSSYEEIPEKYKEHLLKSENVFYKSKKTIIKEIRENLGDLVLYNNILYIKTNAPMLCSNRFYFDYKKSTKFIMNEEIKTGFLNEISEKQLPLPYNYDFFSREYKNSLYTLNDVQNNYLEQNPMIDINVYNPDYFNLEFDNLNLNILINLKNLNSNLSSNMFYMFYMILNEDYKEIVINLKKQELSFSSDADHDSILSINENINKLNNCLLDIKKIIETDEYYSDPANSNILCENFSNYITEEFKSINLKFIDNIIEQINLFSRSFENYQKNFENNYLNGNNYSFY